MKRFILIILLFSSQLVHAQNIPAESLTRLKEIEAIIKPLADSMINADEWLDRFMADSAFTKGFVQALKTPYSFNYKFDSIQNISKVYAPDSSFRIFTWQMMKDYTYYRQRGAIQMKTENGSLKLFPLFDYSDFAKNPIDSVRDARHWIGAIYYKVILKTYNNTNYYTLLGSDANNERSNKKWIEVLHFDSLGNPVFGGRFFQYPEDINKPKQPAFRYCVEYKKDGGVRVNYDPQYDIIIFDRLVGENGETNNKAELVPSGDYEGFKWSDGRWAYIPDPFAGTISNRTQNNLPEPLLDENGNRNQKKLMEKSKEVMDKQGKDATKP